MEIFKHDIVFIELKTTQKSVVIVNGIGSG